MIGVEPTDPPSMAVIVGPGTVVLPDGFGVTADCPLAVTVPRPDATYPRRDRVVIYRPYGLPTVMVLSGTPGAGELPRAPENSVTVAELDVPAGFTSVVAAQIKVVVA